MNRLNTPSCGHGAGYDAAIACRSENYPHANLMRKAPVGASRLSAKLPAATEPLPPPSVDDEPTVESGMESIYASEPTADAEPMMDSWMESTVDDKPATPNHLVDVVAMANGLCDTKRTPAGKCRRGQSRTCCRDRQSRQTNRYLAHDDVHCSEHPSLSRIKLDIS